MTASADELAKIDALIAGKPPERIYHWRNGQLSIARFYGAIKVFGHTYEIDTTDKDMPLVRSDVLARERKERTDAEKEAVKKVEREYWMKQGSLL